MTSGGTYWPFPTSHATCCVCVWCKRQYRGLFRSWQLLKHILWDECADPMG